METAAEQPNVYCKVSGLVEGTGRNDGTAPRHAAFYRPVLDSVWEFFGRDRLIYGSNWPVSARFAELAAVQGIADEYFTEKGPAAFENVFWKNARAAYKWPDR
jgi:L-fuconolactonase